MALVATTRAGVVLKHARKTLKNNALPYEGPFAKTADGEAVDWNHPEAVDFCPLGAIYRAAGTEALYDALAAVQTFIDLRLDLSTMSIPQVRKAMKREVKRLERTA